MPWNVQVDSGSRTEREFLKFPAGLDAIKSVVIRGASVAVRASTDVTGYGNRRVLLAGTVITKDPADTTKYKAYAAASGETPAGVLADDVECGVSQGYENWTSDEAAAMIYHGAVFKAAALIGYSGNETAVKNALTTCKFE